MILFSIIFILQRFSGTKYFFLLLGVFFLTFSLNNRSLAEEKSVSDPFLEIDTYIKNFSQEISRSGKGKCELLSGYKTGQYYNKKRVGFTLLQEEIYEEMFSTCYSKTVQRIDDDIQKKIMTPFIKSGMACQELSSIQDRVDRLVFLRDQLTPRISDLPKKLSQKYCGEDSRSESLGQTIFTWKKLKKKLDDIGKFFDEDKRSKNQKLADEKKEERASKMRKKRVEEQARRRVESFVNDFVQNSIVSPLYSERSHITQNLRSLPNGNSRFVSSSPLSISEMFFPPKDEQGKPFWSAIFSDSVTQKTNDIYKKKFYIRKNATNFENYIVNEQRFITEINTLRKNLQKELEEQESSREFSEAYSESIINALRPFHTTLNNSESFMIEKTKLLEKTINRQNITVH